MDVRDALKEQYHGALAMLRLCVERCPEQVWVEGQHPRCFWRMAYHATFYTHLYLGQNESAFQPWSKHRDSCRLLWDHPEVDPPYSKADLLDYIQLVSEMVDKTVDRLDLATDDPGFPWYKGVSKLSHELMNLRHVQGHIGQLSERLMSHGVDIDWVAKGSAGVAP